MIRVLNGGLVTLTDANEQTIVPTVVNENGDQAAAGYQLFKFELVSGSVQTSVGGPVVPSQTGGVLVQTTRSVAGSRWEHTISPELKNGGNNMRAKGISSFNVYW